MSKFECKMTVAHCENCGSTSPEDIPAFGSHTFCCNELVVDPRISTCRGSHVETAAFQKALN